MQVFISHLFDDRKIADALKKTMTEWGINEEYIFQASDFNNPRMNQSANISDELINYLKNCDLFILIYTHDDSDWSYCTYELGAVRASDSCSTTVVTLSFNGHQPKPMLGKLYLNARNSDEIHGFVTKLFRDPTYVVPDEPRREQILKFQKHWDALNDAGLEAKAKALYEAINLAADTISRDDPRAENHRLQFLQFELDGKIAQTIIELRQTADTQGRNSEAYRKFREDAKDLLRDGLKVTAKSQEGALEEFNIEGAGTGLSLQDLFNSWRREALPILQDDYNTETVPPTEFDWQTSLLEDFSRATEGHRSKPPKFPMRRIRDGAKGNRQPVIVRSREFSSGRREFDVYLFKIPEDD